MRLRSFALLLAPTIAAPAAAANETKPVPWDRVQSALAATCYECHNAKKPKGGVNLESFSDDPKFEAEFALWDKVRQVVAEGSMPPDDADPLLPAEKRSLIQWVDHSTQLFASRNAGDPGPVTLRRLTHVEFGRTLRQLTHQEFRLADAFQPDGGGGEGFSNIGDVLFMSPQQLDHYLSAARKVSEHASVLPGTGIVFHPHNIGLRSSVQVKDQAEQALYVWYQKVAAPLIPGDTDDLREADYMRACWKWKHRKLTGAQSLAQLAKQDHLSPPFLENWWSFLTSATISSRFLDLTRIPWQQLPGPDPSQPSTVPQTVEQKLSLIEAQRRSWYAGADKGQSTVQRRQQDADGLRTYGMSIPVKDQPDVKICVGDVGDGNRGDWVLLSSLQIEKGKERLPYPKWLNHEITRLRQASVDPSSSSRLERLTRLATQFGRHPLGRELAADQIAIQAPAILSLPLPPGATVFRASGQLDMTHPDIDHATVQWQLATGTPPAVDQILPGVLVVYKRQTEAQQRIMGDFGRMKGVFPDIHDRRLEEVARNYQRGGRGHGVYYLSDAQLAATLNPAEKQRFEGMITDWKHLSPKQLSDAQVKSWDQLLLAHLHSFAANAWRRPLTATEKQQLSQLYQAGLLQEMDRETASREVIVRVLVSPHFLYKSETLPAPTPAASPPHTVPLNAWQLASRLSYFLWAAPPDESLRQAAADGSLMTPEGLQHQTLRMLKDPQSNALASEFAGQWFEVADFASSTRMDAEKFPTFTPALRSAMATETQRFFEALVREDLPVTDIVLADYTYLNDELARHYGIPGVTGAEFRQVSVSGHPRGGLLGMGTLLAKTSRPHRTSPVLRGNWLLNAVLGTPVPPPPNDVPEIEEHPEQPRSLREQLQQHREAAACASCHNRIDPLGFALERFDPIGRLRDQDDLGMPLDTSASLPNGTTFDGFEGLRGYLASRQDLFLKHFCRKLTGYALGRGVLISDTPLITEMQHQLQEKNHCFSAAVLALVESRQFKNRRTH